MSTINERQIGLKTGGNYTLLNDYLDKINVARGPFNETQALAGLSASDGSIIDAALIPANVLIADNKKISDGAYTTLAMKGGIVTMVGSTFDVATPTVFVWENVVVSDNYGNVLNGVQIRYEGSHDPVLDTNGRQVFGLLVRASSTTDNAAVGATANTRNLEICFVVNDGTGALVKAAGGVTGDIEFNLNRAFSERNAAKIKLEGGNAVDVDVIADLASVHYSDFLVTAAFGAGEILTLSTGAGDGSGISTPGGDSARVTLNASSAAFVADNTCICTNNGVKGTKGVGKDFDWVSVDSLTIQSALDITDVIGIERRY